MSILYGFIIELLQTGVYTGQVAVIRGSVMETDFLEIDEGTDYVGYQEAFSLISDNIRPVGVEEVTFDSSAGRVAAGDIVARVSYPSSDVSLKDGFAVKSGDVAHASVRRPVCLRVIGSVFAGSSFQGEVTPGNTVKVCSGAPVPEGAEAVVSGEFCEESPSGEVAVKADAGKGRNILRAGSEVKSGAVIVKEGSKLTPGYLGLAAAAGINRIGVYQRPRVAMIGIGDEVIAPGEKLQASQLYASNLVTMGAWLSYFNIAFISSVVKDREADIKRELTDKLPEVDAILTSGGAWGSERDLVIGVLDRLGWREIFHHVRMGPGKGIAFGVWQDKPVFCLPGGPASNEMAFIQLALPGVLRMGGDKQHPLQTVAARLTEDLVSRHLAWTEFKDAILSRDGSGGYAVGLYRNRSRLQAIASANSLVCIPEGKEFLHSGDIVPVQLLTRRVDDI
jgi:molybdopterin molybdotransferase